MFSRFEDFSIYIKHYDDHLAIENKSGQYQVSIYIDNDINKLYIVRYRKNRKISFKKGLIRLIVFENQKLLYREVIEIK